MKLRLDHIALLVRDLDESAAFYTAIPGIREVPNPMGGAGFRWFEFGPNQRFRRHQPDACRKEHALRLLGGGRVRCGAGDAQGARP